jgi:phospholipase D1/2
MRALPVAPFTLVNFFVGATRIRFRDFFLASVIGRIPGIVLLTLRGLQVEMFFRQPGLIGLVLLGLTLVLLPLAWGRYRSKPPRTINQGGRPASAILIS